MGNHLRPGTTGLLAHIDEGKPELLDKRVQASGGRLLRRLHDEVVAEVANAPAAADAAAKEEAKALREKKKAEHKAALEKMRDATRSKLKTFIDKL